MATDDDAGQSNKKACKRAKEVVIELFGAKADSIVIRPRADSVIVKAKADSMVFGADSETDCAVDEIRPGSEEAAAWVVKGVLLLQY